MWLKETRSIRAGVDPRNSRESQKCFDKGSERIGNSFWPDHALDALNALLSNPKCVFTFFLNWPFPSADYNEHPFHKIKNKTNKKTSPKIIRARTASQRPGPIQLKCFTKNKMNITNPTMVCQPMWITPVNYMYLYLGWIYVVPSNFVHW